MASYIDYSPPLNSRANAVTLMRFGAAAAGLNALVAAGIGVAAIYLGHPVLGMDSWCLAGAAVFAVIAWRAHCLSLPWAVVALAIFAFAEIFKLMSHPDFMGIVAVAGGAIIWGPGYVNAVRAGLYLHNTKPPSAYKQEAHIGYQQEEHAGYVPAPMPAATQADDYSEFLQYLRGKGRRFQKHGRTIHDEFEAWSAYRAKHQPAEETESEIA